MLQYARRAGKGLTRSWNPRLAAPGIGRDFGTLVDYKLSDIGEGIFEVEVLDWYVKEGDTVEEWQKICEVQSDKANVEMPSKFPGVIKSIPTGVGEMLQVGKTLCIMEVPDDFGEIDPKEIVGYGEGAAAAEPEPEPAKPAQQSAAPARASAGSSAPAEQAPTGKVLMTPAVRRLLRENNLEGAAIPATGKGGRLLKEDVEDFLAGPAPAAAAAPQKATIVVPQALAEDQVVPIKGIQRIMVQTMTAANDIPMFGYGDDYDLTDLAAVRAALKAAGIKVSYMPFLIKGASMALNKFPSLNAHLSADVTSVTYKAAHNIGIAVDTPTGLLVPNIKDVQQKSVLEISEELIALAAAGRDGKLTTDQMQGGTFTISNIGAIGGTSCSPVVVPPEVCIVALSKLQTLPRFDADGNVTARSLMNFSFSADHRTLDGATVARFSNEWKGYLENPTSMLLGLR